MNQFLAMGRTAVFHVWLGFRLKDVRAISTDILHFSARVLVDQSARVVTGSESDPEHRFADLLPRRAIPGCPRFAAGRTGPRGSDRSRRRNGGQHSTVTRPRRLTGTSRTMPIGWHQREHGAPRLRVTAGRPVPPLRCRSTSRQASVRERPNGAARDCARRRRTRPVDAPWRRCRAGAGRATDVSRNATTLRSWSARTSVP